MKIGPCWKKKADGAFQWPKKFVMAGGQRRRKFPVPPGVGLPSCSEMLKSQGVTRKANHPALAPNTPSITNGCVRISCCAQSTKITQQILWGGPEGRAHSLIWNGRPTRIRPPAESDFRLSGVSKKIGRKPKPNWYRKTVDWPTSPPVLRPPPGQKPYQSSHSRQRRNKREEGSPGKKKDKCCEGREPWRMPFIQSHSKN